MTKFRIDLRSDTKTVPTLGMRSAMMNAEVGDEQAFEDPTVNKLCERVAALLGHEQAIFMPSGTMCNQVAMLVHCRPGDEIIAAECAHISTSESAGGAALAGAQTRSIVCERGIFNGFELARALRPLKRNAPVSRMVAVEQTVNQAGGAIWPLADLKEVSEVARASGLVVHMDGARLLNATVATAVPAAEYGGLCDSVWIDLSKGLGCPVGAVLAGSREFILDAWRWKQRLGGAMRQAGVIAAAGLYAIDNNIARLAEDNAHANRLGDGLRGIPGIEVQTKTIETNILFADIASTGLTMREFSSALEKKGIAFGAQSSTQFRAVTHLGIDQQDIDEVVAEVAATIDQRVTR